jgi:hypothetical protein
VLRYQERAVDKPDREASGAAPSHMLEGIYCGLPQFRDVDFSDTRNLPQTFEVQTLPALYNNEVSQGATYCSYHCGYGALCRERFGCAPRCMMHAGVYDIYDGSPYIHAQALSVLWVVLWRCVDSREIGRRVSDVLMFTLWDKWYSSARICLISSNWVLFSFLL